MELNINATAAALRSAFVAPTLGGAWGGVCPELGFRRFDVPHPGLCSRPSAPPAWPRVTAPGDN